MLPIEAGCMPSTSFSGCTAACSSFIGMWPGTGRWIRMPVTLGSAFSAWIAASISSRVAVSG
jgi:hypothetical protein